MSEPEKKLTPMMERYLEVRGQNPGAILFFRMGDFYELFYEDAVTAAKVLGLTLTSRDKASSNPVPMAGFPYHQLENYLRKLIQAGFRVSVCDQVEDPRQAKGLVRREVTRVVTPGTITDEALLDPREATYLAALATQSGPNTVWGLAWMEVSTGRFWTTELSDRELLEELARIRPAECLISESLAEHPLVGTARLQTNMLCSPRPPWVYSPDASRQRLLDQLQVTTLGGFDLPDSGPCITAAGVLLEYLQDTQRCQLAHVIRIEYYRRGTHLVLDESTRRSLELTHTMRGGSRDGSLLSVMDETATPMGSRLLAEWLSNPLTNLTTIGQRHDAVAELVSEPLFCEELQRELSSAYDLQRLTGRLATGRATPRDLGCLAKTLALLPRMKALLSARRCARLRELEARLELCAEARQQIESLLVDEPPLIVSDGGVIRDGAHAQLDEYRDLARGGKQWMASYQAEEIRRTGIPTLKVGFNKVFGYYLECTAQYAERIPPEYVRKQTLKNQERFITPQLKDYEERVLRAEGQALTLEQELFSALREAVGRDAPRLRQTAEVLAELDVLAGLARLATKAGYCRPEMVAEPVLDIRNGRHPVLDRMLPAGQFVPNETRLAVDSVRIQLITGPNMAGKSTYIRQVALLTVMAQMGSFIPAASARIGVADRVFARVGASDDLGKGQSTFMVEMTETARILNSATARSLVILDEIGRGTSTYDGISLAWAVTEYLHDVVGCRTLFATHYHELTQLIHSLPGAGNWNVAVREAAEDIIFLHQIVPGAADRSYGIHVARLAGLPANVVSRAEVVLQQLESDHADPAGQIRLPPRPNQRYRQFQLTLFEAVEHPVLEALRLLDVSQLSPAEAVNELSRIREQVVASAQETAVGKKPAKRVAKVSAGPATDPATSASAETSQGHPG